MEYNKAIDYNLGNWWSLDWEKWTVQKSLVEIIEFSILDGIRISCKFEETDKMKTIRDDIIKIMKDWWVYRDLYIEYDNIATEMIDNLKWDDYEKAQIWLILIKAFMFKESWNIERFTEELNDAKTYVQGLGKKAGNILYLISKFEK